MTSNMKNHNISHTWSWLLAAFLALASGPGWGAVSGKVQSPGQIIPLAQPTTITVTWAITSSPPPATSFTISSSSGQFIVSGQTSPLATVNTVVSSVVTVPSGAPTATAIITEAVAVPPEVSVRAIEAGVRNIVYQRTFSDGTSTSLPVPAQVMIAGSGLAGFGISRIALTFDDGAVVRIVPLKSRLSASADVTFVGSGALRGDWEVADPTSTSGTPIFRQVQSVVQGLGGAERVKLTSPDLPTEIPGLHMVRLRVIDPPPGFDPPVLYYYVGEPKPGMSLSLMPITVNNPPNRTYVDAATQFSWQPVKDARAYKIEIFANPDSMPGNLPDLGGAPAGVDPQLARRAISWPPVAGMLVTAKQTQITLSASTRAKLQQQHSYFWRIQAIGADGAVIGEAQVREIRVP